MSYKKTISVKGSNFFHKKAISKASHKFKNAKNLDEKSKARLSSSYHQQIIVLQTNFGRVLSKSEREAVFEYYKDLESAYVKRFHK